MRCRRTSAGDGNMRQRGEIVKRIAFAMKIAAELSISNARLNRHCAALAVYLHHAIKMLQRDDVLSRVRDAIEGMPSSERLQLAAAPYQLLHLLDGFGIVPSGRAVGVITRPVLLRFIHVHILRKHRVFEHMFATIIIALRHPLFSKVF